jgi:metal-responsive CopG/Arc/MetJ family transcriptional regulator
MPTTAATREAKCVKIAIDFPAPLLRETERAMHELSINRSHLIRSAVEMFLRQREREKLERAIAESFEVNRELDQNLVDEFKYVEAETDLNF